MIRLCLFTGDIGNPAIELQSNHPFAFSGYLVDAPMLNSLSAPVLHQLDGHPPSDGDRVPSDSLFHFVAWSRLHMWNHILLLYSVKLLAHLQLADAKCVTAN